MLQFTWFIIISCIEYWTKDCKNFKILKFSRKLPPKVISFIILNKNQDANGKKMAIMMHGMQKK